MKAGHFLLRAVLVVLVAAFLRIHQLETYPPGPHFDESANVLITRSIASGANLFPIANSYQGRESLYFYLAQPIFRFVDDSVFGLQVVSVFANLLTIAASMALGRAMLPGRRGQWLGLVVGLLMAVSFHQIFMSRQAYRAVTLPLMQALGILFLWWGLKRERHGWGWLWLVLGGVFCAGALYTYMASRLLPLWLGLAALLLLWLDRARWLLRLRQGVIFFGAFILAALPMLIYALQNPDIFLQRLTEVSDGEVTVSLAESIRRHIEMFFIRGDFGNLRYNDPGRPYFTLLEAPFFLIGIAAAAWTLLRGKKTLVRIAAFFLLLAPLMIIPSVVSVAGFPPSHMRSLGMVPFIFLLVGLGVVYAGQALTQRLKVTVPAMTALFALVLLGGGASVYAEYMGWASRADLFYQADGDLAAAADWLRETVDDEHVYVASFNPEHPTVITRYGADVTWLGLTSLFLPPSGEAGIMIFPHQNPPPDAWFALLEPGWIDDVPAGPDGDPAFWAFRVEGQPYVLDDTVPRNAYLQMVDAQGVIPAGEQGALTLTWNVLSTPPYGRLRPVLTVLDAVGETLAFSDVFLLGTDRWRTGERVLQQVRVDIPPGTPPGDYPVVVAWVDRDSDALILYEDGSTRAEVGTMTVTSPPTPTTVDQLAIEHLDRQSITAALDYLGYTRRTAEAVRPGESLLLTTYWQAQSAIESTYDLMLSLDTNGDTIPLDTQPLSAVGWQAGDVLAVPFRWTLPRDLPDGTYTLRLGIQDNLLDLGTVTVAGQPRVMSAPEVAASTDAAFGDVIGLYGYTLDESDEALTVSLIWQSLQAVDIDYTVFVHLLDGDGVLVDQRDAMPQNYTYPTSLWVEDEYIVDIYTFDGPIPDDYRLRIGLYQQETGDRLLVHVDTVNLNVTDYYEIIKRQ